MRIEPWRHARDHEALNAFVSKSYRKNYDSYTSLFGEAKISELALTHTRQLLGSESSIAVACWNGDDLMAIAAASLLPWDTDQFGFVAARIDLFAAPGIYPESRSYLETLLPVFLGECQKHNIRHLIVRLASDELASLHVLGHAGFELIDGIQTFSRHLEQEPPPLLNGDFEIRQSGPGDVESVAEIARTSYTIDRFHSDNYLTGRQADDIHETWVRNSLSGKAADSVLVVAQGSQVLGFVTCKIDQKARAALGVAIGGIILVATAEKARGKGVAREATQESLRWFWNQGVNLVEVGTQLSNVKAARIYEQGGFRLSGVSFTLRRWFPQ